jgi:hypothetical protein
MRPPEQSTGVPGQLQQQLQKQFRCAKIGCMDTQVVTRKTRGRPFRKGNPGGPGRPKADSPEEKAKRVREAVQRRVVTDLVGEMRAAADLAIDAMVTIVGDPTVKPADRVAAARTIFDRGFGTPVSTTLTVAADTTFDRAAAEGVLAALRKDAP